MNSVLNSLHLNVKKKSFLDAAWISQISCVFTYAALPHSYYLQNSDAKLGQKNAYADIVVCASD